MCILLSIFHFATIYYDLHYLFEQRIPEYFLPRTERRERTAEEKEKKMETFRFKSQELYYIPDTRRKLFFLLVFFFLFLWLYVRIGKFMLITL